MQTSKPLRCPRKMSDLGREEASGLVAPAYGMPGDPAAIEAMVLERARARRRPSGTPLESGVFAPGHSSSGGGAAASGGRVGGSPRRSRSHAHPQHRDPVYATPSTRTPANHANHASPARRPLVGVESAAHAGLDTATTVQYITQLEHQLTALEGEHGRLCRVLLKSVAHNAVADCELAEAITRREITDEAMASQLRISGLLAKHLAHTAVTLGMHEQLSNVRTGNDPRRSFADAVSSLAEIRGDLEVTAEAISAAGASVRQRDSAWRAEMSALTDAVSTTRAEMLRGLSHQGSSTSDAVDELGKEIRRSLSNVNESVQAVETGTAVKLHSMLQQHTAAADASAAGVTTAIGQLHNEVRADERERQRYMSEQFHALSRKVDDVLAKQRADGPGSPGKAHAAPGTDDIAQAVDAAMRASSTTVAQQVSDTVVDAITAGEERRLEIQGRTDARTTAVASIAFLSAAATAHMDSLFQSYVDALAAKASVVADEIPRAMRAAEAAVASLSESFAAALSRAGSADAGQQQQPTSDTPAQATTMRTVGSQTTSLRTATADVQAVERTRPCGVQTLDASGGHRAVAVQTSAPIPLSPSRRASSSANEHPVADQHADDEGFTTFPSVSDEITASGSPNASNVFGPPGITQSMEVASSPGKGGTRTLPPTPMPSSPNHSFEATKRGGMSPVSIAAHRGEKHPAAAAAAGRKPARVVASAPPPNANHDDDDDDTDGDLSTDVDLSLDEDDTHHAQSPPPISTGQRGSSITSESRSPTAAGGGNAAGGLPPRPQSQATRKPPPAAPSIEVEGVPLQMVTSESMDAAPDFRGGGTDDLFANLSINAFPPDATLLDAGMPDSVRSNDSLADMENSTSALGRRLAGGMASPRFSGGATRVAGSPRGEAIPSPFREAARLKRASSFDSPTAAVRSPRNRAVCFIGAEDAGGSSQNLSPQRSKEFSSSPQATPRSMVSPRSSGNGGLMLPGASVAPRQVSPAPDSMMTTPTGVTPVATPTASALHLGTKKRGLPSLGGLGGQKPASTAASMGVPGKSQGTVGSGGSSHSLGSWSPASNSPGTGAGFPSRPAASAGAAASGSSKPVEAYDDWDDDDGDDDD